jgi:flagellar biosynthesis/type III secretory pathway protein FliH
VAFADLKNDFVAGGAELWAWLFVHAPELEAVPADLPAGPFREALDLANKATFTQTELDAYQKVIDEINQARELAEAKWEEGHKSGLAEGHKSGLAEGLAAGKRDSLLRILEIRKITLTDEERDKILRCADIGRLDQWLKNALTASTAPEALA